MDQSLLMGELFSSVVVVSLVLIRRLEVRLLACLTLLGRVSQEVARSNHNNTLLVSEALLFVDNLGLVFISRELLEVLVGLLGGLESYFVPSLDVTVLG